MVWVCMVRALSDSSGSIDFLTFKMAVDEVISVDVATVNDLASFLLPPVRESAALVFAADNDVTGCSFSPVRVHASRPFLVKLVYKVIFHLFNTAVLLLFTFVDECLVEAFDGIGLFHDDFKAILHTVLLQELFAHLIPAG